MLLPYINHTYEVPKQDSFFMLYFTYNGEENKPINAGKYEVKCSSFLSENAQTIANYKIVSVEGIDDAATFEILKRKVEITPILSETSKIYDGTQFVYKDIRYTLKDVTPGATIVNYTNSLPYNGVIDKFYVLYKKLTDKENNIYTPIDKVINAGSYLVTFSDWESTEKGNYDVTFKDVNYEIGKRNVSIMPYIENLSNENVVRDYNSEAYVYNSANYTIIDRDGKKYDNELPFAHDKEIIINDLVVEYYIKNVSGEFVKVNDATDAGTYYVKVVSWKPEILKNYIVTASNEKLEFVIDKYDITISYDSGLESNILGRYDVVDGVAVEHVLPNINQFKYLNDNRFFGTDGIKVTATCAKKLVDAGTYRISLNYELITENSGNYNIIVKPVEVEIEKAEVLLKPLDQTHTYDSLSYQYPSGSYLITSINGRVCEDNKLLLGESVSVKVTYDREPIIIGDYTIYGQSVLGSTNYDYIFIDSATLTIKEMTVTVAPEFGDKLYGQDYAYDSTQFTTTIGSIGTNDKVTMAVYYVQYNEDTTVNTVFLGSSNIDDLPIELQQYAVSGYPINVGDYYSYISRMEITSKSNDEDRSSNYDVSTTYNTFEVGSNEITISIKNQVETYNGYGIPYNSEYNIEGKLITGDFADIRVYYIGEDGQVYLGNSDINDLDIALQENAIKGYPINAGTYKIYISNISIISQRMNNYIVHWSNNENITLTIDKRTVTFRPKVENEKELIYNFEELTPELDITYNSGSLELVLNHQVIPTGYRYFDSKGIPITAQDIINAGTYYVEIAGHNLVNFKEGEDTNYKFSFERTRFKVSALDVTIELADQEKPYDGLAFDEFVIKGVTSNPLVADKVSALQFKVRQVMGSGNLFKNVTEIVNVDTYDITSIVSWEVTGDIADNFNIIIQKGTKYTITPLTIDLTLGSQEFTYNGDKKTYDNYLFNGVLSGYTIDPILIFTKDGKEYSENELVHFGVYNITLAGYNLFDSEGKEIIDYDSNYEVNITKDSNPIVTIKQLEITLTTNDQKLAYTTQFIGYDPQYLGFRDIDGKVIPDYKLFTFDVYYLDFNDSTKVVTNPTNVGKYYILIDKSSVKVNNEYNDYIINVESDLKNVGILEITKANIEISFIKTIGTYGTPKGIDYHYDVLTLIEGKVVKLEGFTIENLIIKYYKDGQLIVDEKGLPMLPKNVGTYTAEFVDYTLKYNGTIIEDKSNFAVSFLKDSDPTIIIDTLFVSIDGRHYNEYHEYDGQAITRADNEYWPVDLPYGDKITITPQIYVDGKLYTSDMVHAGMYEIRLLEENLSFISGSKENYKFVYNSGYYQIIPKNVYVEIIASDNGKVYDGEKVEVTWNYITGSAPIGDDILDLSSVLKYNLTRQKDSYLGNGYVNEVKDAGTYRISFGNDFVVTSSIGSYTSDYSIIYTNLTYVIKQREIKITTPSKTVYYSGVEVHAFEKENLKLQEGYELVTGHELGIALTGNAITSISKYEVGTKENILDIWVFDGNDNVTDNYNISESEWGTITVLPRPIIVKSGTSSRVYEGSATSKNFIYKEFTMRDVEGVELPPLDYSMLTTKIIPTSKSKVRFVTDGIVENRFNFSAVYEGEDISPCFDVIKEYGTIHITERPMTVGFNPEFTNWNWYSGAEFDISKLLIAVDGTTLGAGDKINAKASLRYFKTHDKYGNPIEPVEVDSLINAGTYRVVIGDIVITKNNGSDVLTENYDISIDTSITEFMVTIKPLTIRVETNTEAKIWDGKPLYNTGIHANRSEYSQEGYGMLSNHDVRAKTDGNYTIVPAYDKNGEKVIGTFDNNLEYEVYDTLTGEIVTDNYIIDEDPGELIVVDYFIIDYWTNSEYTGQNHTISTVTGTCEDFHNNQIHNLRFEIEVSCNEMVEIGSYELIPNYDTLILYVNGEDWTNVYKDYLVIEKSSFMYNISPINVHMKPKDLEDAIYNGERQGCTPDQFEDGINYEILSGRLLPGHYAEIETKYSFITQSSTSNNYITGVTIRDEQGNDVTNLYSITYNAEWSTDIKVRQRYYAKLKVLKFEIKYTTGSAEKTYDGTPLTCEQYEIDPNIVASLNELLAKLGHRIDVYRIPSLTLPTTQTGNNTLGIRIVDSNGRPVNGAYSFKCQAGTLKVNPLVITIETPDVEFEYDGDEHSSSVNDCKYISGLLEGHTLEIKKMTTYWQPVITQNEVVSFKVYDANGTDVSSGYVIEYSKCGQFIIR